MINFLKWLPALATALAMLLAQRSLMHDFQLESYQFPGYFRTLRRNWKRALLPGVTLAAYLTLLYLAYRSVDRMLDMSVGKILLALVNAALAVAGGWWCRSIFQQKKAKKPFVVTMRVKRTYIVMGVVYTLLCTPIALLTKVYFCGLLPLLLPLWVALGGLLAWPIEKLVSEMYFRDAQKKLAARPDIIKIGITGSYGKTSVKFILGTILQEKYQTLITPSSFNTPMGVTRVIREQLTPAHQVFIAEMGARHVGDIRELVELVHPQMGMITSVGPQHLDTFGTIERVRDTKYELIEGLPKDGTAVFARDGAICEALFERCPLERKYKPGMLVDAKNVACGPWGTRFTLTDVQTGEEASCQTRLLGEHSISNLLLCCTAARALGMTLQEIALGVSRCQPVEHRLELLSGGAVGALLVDLLLLGAEVGLQRVEGAEAQTLGKGLIGGGSDLLGQRAEVDLELRGLAGQLGQAEILRVGEVEAEHLTGTVAVDGLLGGGHQPAVAQHHHDILHPAVGDLLAVHVADKIQQGTEAALGRGGGGVVDGVHPGLMQHLDVHGLVGDRADVAGDGEALVLAQLYFGQILFLLFHSGILLMT